MYTEDGTLTPRDRISDEMLGRMLGLTDSPAPQRQEMPSVPHTAQSLRLPDGFPLASVYAPTQVFRNLYDRETALSRGTIFKELDLPFMGMTVTKGGSCRG